MNALSSATRRGWTMFPVALAAVLTVSNPHTQAQEPKPPSEKTAKAVAALKKLYFSSVNNDDGVWTVELEYVKDLNAAVSLVLDLERVDKLGFGKNATDAHLSTLLPKLRGLRGLTINFNDNVTDAGLAHIKGLTELRALQLVANEKVTKDGIANISGLTSLETLELSFTKLTNATKPLAGLTKLKELDIAKCGLTDVDAANLAGLTALKKLNLSFNDDLTDAGMSSLAKLKQLEELKINCTNIGNAGLKSVSYIKNSFV